MSAPSPPKPQKINPYAGVESNSDVRRAQQALGIDKVKKDKDKRRIDEWLLEERWSKELERSSFNNAYKSGMREGQIGRDDRTQWALDKALADEQTLLYDRQTAEQQEQLQSQYDQMRIDQQESTAAQQEMMEEMMNQPVYMAKQQAAPVVAPPPVENSPLLPAPNVDTPMSISAPPPPELANTGQRMAIVKTSKSSQSRSRKATRGTSSLIN